MERRRVVIEYLKACRKDWRLAAWPAALMLPLVIFVGVGMEQSAQAQVSISPRRETWSCSLDNVAASLTLCIGNPDNRRAMFLTDVLAQSTTSTGGQFIIRYGTGSNCATGTTSLLPSAATAARLSAAGNGVAATSIQLLSAPRVPPGNDICILGVATNTFSGQLMGYYE
jgi:hypothetical protein